MTASAPQTAPLIRGPRKQDQAYIATTWLKQLVQMEPGDAVGERYGAHGRRVDAVLDRGDTRALIRHAPGDRDAILGWVVYAEGPGVPLLHMVYVRKEHRGKGYGSELLHAMGIERTTPFVYTCVGPSTRKMLNTYRAASYVPLKEFLSP